MLPGRQETPGFGSNHMSSTNGNDANVIEAMLRALVDRQDFDERIGDSIADDIEYDAAMEAFSPELSDRARTAVKWGMFDASVARTRGSGPNNLRGFGPALTTIRSAAGRTCEQMAERADIPLGLWESLEAQTISVTSVDAEQLTSVIEAVQLKRPEFQALLRGTISLRRVSGRRAAIESDPYRLTDTHPHEEDLVAAVSKDSALSSIATSESAVESLISRIAEELLRRGRTDLL